MDSDPLPVGGEVDSANFPVTPGALQAPFATPPGTAGMLREGSATKRAATG
jgi:hypothetical protein